MRTRISQGRPPGSPKSRHQGDPDLPMPSMTSMHEMLRSKGVISVKERMKMIAKLREIHIHQNTPSRSHSPSKSPPHRSPAACAEIYKEKASFRECTKKERFKERGWNKSIKCDVLESSTMTTSGNTTIHHSQFTALMRVLSHFPTPTGAVSNSKCGGPSPPWDRVGRRRIPLQDMPPIS